jgi:predicted MPP superfamily phosphohydrolase
MHLKIDSNNEYRIMQLTDLHFGESQARDDMTVKMIE